MTNRIPIKIAFNISVKCADIRSNNQRLIHEQILAKHTIRTSSSSEGNSRRSSWQRAYLERVIGSIRNRLIVPIDTTGSKTGTIRKRQRLGGLLNYYYRTAA
jgi:hypothetical protein